MSFDITKHEWRHKAIIRVNKITQPRELHFVFDDDRLTIGFNEKDAIAIAKYFDIYQEPEIENRFECFMPLKSVSREEAKKIWPTKTITDCAREARKKFDIPNTEIKEMDWSW